MNFPLFVELLKKAEESGKLSREEATLLRNQAATLTRPACPPKLARALAEAINVKLGTKIA